MSVVMCWPPMAIASAWTNSPRLKTAIVVVAGDVTVEEVRTLAEAAYGALRPNPDIKTRQRPQEPPHRAARRLELKDPRAGNASVRPRARRRRSTC